MLDSPRKGLSASWLQSGSRAASLCCLCNARIVERFQFPVLLPLITLNHALDSNMTSRVLLGIETYLEEDLCSIFSQLCYKQKKEKYMEQWREV